MISFNSEKDQKLIKITLDIEGMTCNHCVGKVKDALLKTQGVYDIDVQLKSNSATFNMIEGVDVQSILDQIKNVGFIARVKEK